MAGGGDYTLRRTDFNKISKVRVGGAPRHLGCLLHCVSNDNDGKR